MASSFSFRDKRKRKKKRKFTMHTPPSSASAVSLPAQQLPKKKKRVIYIYTPKGVYSLLLLFARENMMEKRERDWTAAGRWLPYNRAVFLFPCVSLLV